MCGVCGSFSADSSPNSVASYSARKLKSTSLGAERASFLFSDRTVFRELCDSANLLRYRRRPLRISFADGGEQLIVTGSDDRGTLTFCVRTFDPERLSNSKCRIGYFSSGNALRIFLRQSASVDSRAFVGPGCSVLAFSSQLSKEDRL